MMRYLLIFCTTLLLVSPLSSFAEDESKAERELIYGWHIMSREERNRFRFEIQQTENEDARQRYLNKHYTRMLQRADELNIDLDPPPRPVHKGAIKR